jgi:adenine-specific DNA-methyltransferase
MSRHIDKAELISKLQTLEGLTVDERSSLIGLLREHKKYGLVWEDKPEDVEERLREELPVLREVKDKAILSDDPDAPNHILIEGDNLEALTALSYTHEGKIDVIYIDPPYNTGNKDFVYNDSYVDTEDSYRHSKWLSFMNKRLKIAKKLLSDKGVIFISIDDNEQANLKLLCDEVFCGQNFIANIIWEKADSPRMDAKIISSRHDFIVAYAKDIITLPLNKIKVLDIPEHYNKIDEEGRRYYLKPLRYMGNADRREDRPNMYYPIIAPDGTNVLPVRADGSDGRWRWSKEKVEEEHSRLDFIKAKKGWSVYTRLYADKMSDIPVETIWYNNDVESNRQAIATIKQIFGSEKTFTNPKPVKLIKRIAQISGTANSTILDFFAGSGTTLHATMQLNAEDGGHRQCILVTNNENNICEEVTYERNKRVINGYTTPKGVEVEGLKANTLRYYKTDYISRDPSSKNKRELVKAATDLLCIKEGLYQETKMTCKGKTLRKDYARRFSAGNNEMIIIYEPAVIKYIVEELKVWDKKEFIKVYVFSEGRYAYDDDFKEVLNKVTLCALPDAIYQAYKRVLPRRKKAQLASIDINEDEQAEALSDAEHYSYKEEKGGEA